jgi:hypothetical protein
LAANYLLFWAKIAQNAFRLENLNHLQKTSSVFHQSFAGTDGLGGSKLPLFPVNGNRTAFWAIFG